MPAHPASPERMSAFSDGVAAVVITLMVLELKAPDSARLSALVPLWPTAASYAVSYLFVAIVWMNHHHLMRFVRAAGPRLLWINFAHLFLVSLLPFATAWMARSHLAPAPVATYASLFVAVNLAFIAFEREVMRLADPAAFPAEARRLARRRSASTLAIFAAAAVVSAVAPLAGFGLICAALVFYLRPDAQGRRLPPPRLAVPVPGRRMIATDS